MKPKALNATLTFAGSEGPMAEALREQLILKLGDDSVGYLKLPGEFKRRFGLVPGGLPNPVATYAESDGGRVKLTYEFDESELRSRGGM